MMNDLTETIIFNKIDKLLDIDKELEPAANKLKHQFNIIKNVPKNSGIEREIINRTAHNILYITDVISECNKAIKNFPEALLLIKEIQENIYQFNMTDNKEDKTKINTIIYDNSRPVNNIWYKRGGYLYAMGDIYLNNNDEATYHGYGGEASIIDILNLFKLMLKIDSGEIKAMHKYLYSQDLTT